MMRRMLIDSLAPLLLFACCAAAWSLAGGARASPRANIRFAAILFAALAVAVLLGVALPAIALAVPAVALIVASLGGTALALALFGLTAHPLPPLVAALGLILALGFGLASALSGQPAYALACPVIALCISMGAAIAQDARRMPLLLAGLPLLCGAFCLMQAVNKAALLFFAAGLIAIASQARVETQDKPGALRAIRSGL